MRFEQSLENELREARQKPTRESLSAHETFISSLQELALEIRFAFEKQTLDLLKQTHYLAPALQRSIQEKQLFVPLTEVYDTPQTIRDRLTHLNLDEMPSEISAKDVLFLFHLPKTLRQHELLLNNWRRENVLGLLIKAYGKGMQAFWEHFNAYTKTHPVNVRRLNKPRAHENRTEGYYYVFLLSPKKIAVPAPSAQPVETAKQTEETPIPTKPRLSQRSLKKQARQAHWRAISRPEHRTINGTDTQKTHSQLQADQ